MTQTIYVHGLGQNASAWNQVLSHLDDSDALCPDLPSLLSGRPPVYEQLYAAFSAYCDTPQKPVTLCGLSLGAILAMHYAIDHPDQVRALVLIGAQYKMPRRLLALQSFVMRFMKSDSFQAMGFEKETFLRLTSSMRTLDFSGDLKHVRCGTLVLCGEKDRANHRAALELAERLPHAEFQTIPSAGHEANLDAPEVLAGILKQYYSHTH